MILARRGEWKPITDQGLGFLNILSDAFAKAEIQGAEFPQLRSAQSIIVASDYSGEHPGAAYQTMSFLLADRGACADWQPLRQEFRLHYLHDGRRISYKSLNDRVRRRALPAFFQMANCLPGLLASFVIPSRINTLFDTSGGRESCELLSGLSPSVEEKLLRVVHLLALLIAGFSRQGQNILWVTDSDAIAANNARSKTLADIVATVTSNCINHDLGHFRLATSANDKGDRSLEDLLSIPDLAAGALSSAFVSYFGNHGAPVKGFFLRSPPDLPAKTRLVMDWFASNICPLRRIVIMIDEPKGKRGLRATTIRFHGSNDHY